MSRLAKKKCYQRVASCSAAPSLVAGVLAMPTRRLVVLAFAGLCAVLPLRAQERFITVASTTSTEQSGLFGHLLPAFAARTGIAVKVVAVGTGQALDIGRRGDADVVLVHDTAEEER